jgi:hypothetical protein
MKVGSIWTGSNFVEFKIKDIKTVGDNTWIYYYKISTGQQYSCLKEAFIDRFKEKVN